MKRAMGLGLVIGLILMLSGCIVKEIGSEKLKDLEFTVVSSKDIPKELMTKIEAGKEKPLKITYIDGGTLYICEGYGKRESSGYSIEVTECYETNNAVYFHTNLLGPAKDEKVVNKTTYPYLVIKTEYNDKNVVFD